MKKAIAVILLILLISLASCSPDTSDSAQEVSPSVGGCGVSSTMPLVEDNTFGDGGTSLSQENLIVQEQNQPFETLSIDKNDFDKIFFTFHGVDRERMLLIVTSIHPRYFEGVKIVEFIYSNPQYRSLFANGWYYPDSKKITLYVYDESDGFIHHNLLHELKHHSCYINTGKAEINHEGCFLNTPIDKEYGFIQ